jgi:hypothetical protein
MSLKVITQIMNIGFVIYLAILISITIQISLSIDNPLLTFIGDHVLRAIVHSFLKLKKRLIKKVNIEVKNDWQHKFYLKML